MKLYKLLKSIHCRVMGNVNIEISGLYHNDSKVQSGGLFFCINGTKTSGENYTQNAIKNGAVAIVTEREIKSVYVTQIIVNDVRHTMAVLSSLFFDEPSKKLKIVGVTGTNGKTSTTYILNSMFRSAGIKNAIIGTNGVIYEDKIIETGMTTPDPIELHSNLNKIYKSGAEYVFIEVSAHALDLKKLDGIMFDAMIFTNLTEDHLDYFGDIEKYFKAKEKAFLQNRTRLSILNLDDSYGVRLAESIKTKILTYSTTIVQGTKADNICIENSLQKFEVDGVKFSSNLLGKFNVSNLLSAICYMRYLGYSLEKLSNYVSLVEPVPGRFNVYGVNDKTFIIDYAHTPDGLENVLRLCSDLKKENAKLICVFGCGGNRETQKRKIMGEISSKIANFSIITTDNPRFESSLDIAKQIESGMINKNYKIILDRATAIKYANEITSKHDLILIAGKGEENYIDELGKKTPYSDREEVLKLKEYND